MYHGWSHGCIHEERHGILPAYFIAIGRDGFLHNLLISANSLDFEVIYGFDILACIRKPLLHTTAVGANSQLLTHA
jgi:hypothetical protein